MMDEDELRREGPDSIMDMDPRVRWELLFNYLNDMALILRRIDRQTKRQDWPKAETIVDHEGEVMKMGDG